MDHSIPTAPTRRRPRLATALAILTAGALAASGVALGATSASAADGDLNVVDASFTWGFNNYTSPTAGFTVGAASGNLAAAPDVSIRAFTATNGQGVLDSTGSGTIAFTGSVQYNNTQGSVVNLFTLTDPQLTITGGNEGTLTAAVSSFTTSSNPYFDTTKNGTRVPVATFDITESSADGELTITTGAPDYTPSGVYLAGAWPASFVALFTGGAGFWGDKTTADARKAPLAFSVAATTATPTVTPTVTYPSAGGLDIAVAGTGFAKLNAGVYVGVGPVGLDLGQTTDPAYAVNFYDAAYLPTSAITAGGGIATVLHVATDSLAANGSYAVYTWNAHAHATTASDTVTALPFAYSSLADAVSTPVDTNTPAPVVIGTTAPVVKAASTVVVNPVRTTYGSSAKLVATVPATATGIVTFVSDGIALGSAPVSGGAASAATSATTAVGTHSITATYSGDAAFEAGTSAATTLKVAKATVSVALAGKKFARSTKPKVTVTVGTLANGTRVAGKVAIYVGKVKVTTVPVTSKKRVVSVTLPKKYSRAITVKAKFLGGATTVAKTSSTIKLAVKK